MVKKVAVYNVVTFIGILLVIGLMVSRGSANAEEVAATAAVAQGAAEGWKYIGAGLAVGLACIGAGIAVASSASAALGAISENPEVMGKAMIFVALAESVALYGLLIAFFILS